MNKSLSYHRYQCGRHSNTVSDPKVGARRHSSTIELTFWQFLVWSTAIGHSGACLFFRRVSCFVLLSDTSKKILVVMVCSIGEITLACLADRLQLEARMLCPRVHLGAFIVRRLIRAVHDPIYRKPLELMVSAACILIFKLSIKSN